MNIQEFALQGDPPPPHPALLLLGRSTSGWCHDVANALGPSAELPPRVLVNRWVHVCVAAPQRTL